MDAGEILVAVILFGTWTLFWSGVGYHYGKKKMVKKIQRKIEDIILNKETENAGKVITDILGLFNNPDALISRYDD